MDNTIINPIYNSISVTNNNYPHEKLVAFWCIKIFTLLGIIVGILISYFIYDNTNTITDKVTKYMISILICTIASNFIGIIVFNIIQFFMKKKLVLLINP